MKVLYFREAKKKMVSKKKKIFILCGMALLLVVTGFLNYQLNSKVDTEIASSTTTLTVNFFTTYRTDRTESRNSQIDLLNQIIQSEYSTAEERSSATSTKTDIIKKMETELVLEGLIKAKGFDDAIVTIGANFYNVMVKNADNLTPESVAQILNIITTETGASATNVKIIPIE